jgi:hypothetical protein
LSVVIDSLTKRTCPPASNQAVSCLSPNAYRARMLRKQPLPEKANE